MYSNLNLYYLNQLGITPWIKKDQLLNFNNNTLITKQSKNKLVILCKAGLNKKAELLLNRIIAYINVEDSELMLLQIDEGRQWHEQFKNAPPTAFLAFGIESDDFPVDLKPHCTVRYSLSLDYLLNNPSDKRKVFKDLQHINNLFYKI